MPLTCFRLGWHWRPALTNAGIALLRGLGVAVTSIGGYAPPDMAGLGLKNYRMKDR